MERYFTITLGASRIEFSVGVENGKYVGKINGRVHMESTDYDAVRASILEGMEEVKNSEVLN